MVFFGDYIGTIEEFIPGHGTYVKDGKIYAANIGNLVPNKERIAIINSKVSKLKEGDIIFGQIVAIREDSAVVSIQKIIGNKNTVNLTGRIFVQNISNTYVKSVDTVFGIGDIIKSKVVRVENNLIDLSTKGNLGIVKAFCKYCRHPLKYDDKKNILVCQNCGKESTRKISDDYGNCTDILL